MAPLEVESQVTLIIESALNGAPGVRRVRSSTAVGVSIVWAEFDWGTDPYRARQVIGEKIQTVIAALPPEVEPPMLMPETSIMGEVMFLSLTSDRQTPTEMHTWADTVLRRRVLAVPGIAMAGGYELLKLLQGRDGAVDWGMMGLGTAVAAVTGYLCIRWLLGVITRIGLGPFALYRLAIAARVSNCARC